MKRPWRVATLLVALVAGGALAATWWAEGELEVPRVLVGWYLEFRRADSDAPVGEGLSVPFMIEPGENASTIGPRLQAAGLIRDAELFQLLAEYTGADVQLIAGQYKLSPKMSMREILETIHQGRVVELSITIPEGWRIEEIAQLLSERGLMEDRAFLRAAGERYDYPFLAERPEGASLEGYLFPDTYRVRPGISPRELTELMLDNFDQRLNPELRRLAQERGMSLYEVLTLASIVEREAVIAEERPVIASVYLNRLAAGLPLEADSTVQYALGYDAPGASWWRRLALEQLRAVESPYNTYLHLGLPPGPICNPGLASILAVLEPAATPYLYYYAVGDGSHVFAETYEEHLQNQARYGRR